MLRQQICFGNSALKRATETGLSSTPYKNKFFFLHSRINFFLDTKLLTSVPYLDLGMDGRDLLSVYVYL